MNDMWLVPTILITIVGATWSLAWWFSKQFGSLRSLIHSKTEQLEKFILEKLEYHEKHDDDRFSQLGNQIVEIRLRNASKDMLMDKILDQHDLRRIEYRPSGTKTPSGS